MFIGISFISGFLSNLIKYYVDYYLSRSDLGKACEIFDTINSLGVKLTTSELLKNYIFNDGESQLLYREFWESIFESDAFCELEGP